MADVTIALVYPDLLGTYGDGGNAAILARRLRWRGIAAEVVTVTLGLVLPRTCEVYVLGGGEDGPQALAAAELRAEGALGSAVEHGAVVLAVCAGLQVLGTRFLAADGVRQGVGLVDAATVERLAERAVGELAVDPALAGLPRLSGYENHAGRTVLGPGVVPFARVASGVGNDGTGDGFVAGRILGTYLHGPVLARNPELADLILSWAVGPLPPMPRPEVDADALALRTERLRSTGGHVRARVSGARNRPGPLTRLPRSPWTRRPHPTPP